MCPSQLIYRADSADPRGPWLVSLAHSQKQDAKRKRSKDLMLDLKDTHKEKSHWSLSLWHGQSSPLELLAFASCHSQLHFCCSKYPSAVDPRPGVHQGAKPHRANRSTPLSVFPSIPPEHWGQCQQAEVVDQFSTASIKVVFSRYYHRSAGKMTSVLWHQLKSVVSWSKTFTGSKWWSLLTKLIIFTMA